MEESSDAPVATTKPESDKPFTYRLVIRAQILPDEPAPPVPRRRHRRAFELLLGALVVLALSWAGYRLLRPDASTASRPAARDVVRIEMKPLPAPAVVSSKDGPATHVNPPAQAVIPERGASEEPPSPVNEVLPTVPPSALQTIRGTIRVSVRAIVDRNGAVQTVTVDDPGPSRYFERLAVTAAKQWTFTRAATEDPRTVLLQFQFTRTGAGARASPAESVHDANSRPRSGSSSERGHSQ